MSMESVLKAVGPAVVSAQFNEDLCQRLESVAVSRNREFTERFNPVKVLNVETGTVLDEPQALVLFTLLQRIGTAAGYKTLSHWHTFIFRHLDARAVELRDLLYDLVLDLLKSDPAVADIFLDWYLREGQSSLLQNVLIDLGSIQGKTFFERLHPLLLRPQYVRPVLELLTLTIQKRGHRLYEVIETPTWTQLLNLAQLSRVNENYFPSVLWCICKLIYSVPEAVQPYCSELFGVFRALFRTEDEEREGGDGSYGGDTGAVVPGHRGHSLPQSVESACAALFRGLYAIFPGQFLTYLRSECSLDPDFEPLISPLLQGLPFHPGLLHDPESDNVGFQPAYGEAVLTQAVCAASFMPPTAHTCGHGTEASLDPVSARQAVIAGEVHNLMTSALGFKSSQFQVSPTLAALDVGDGENEANEDVVPESATHPPRQSEYLKQIVDEVESSTDKRGEGSTTDAKHSPELTSDASATDAMVPTQEPALRRDSANEGSTGVDITDTISSLEGHAGDLHSDSLTTRAAALKQLERAVDALLAPSLSDEPETGLLPISSKQILSLHRLIERHLYQSASFDPWKQIEGTSSTGSLGSDGALSGGDGGGATSPSTTLVTSRQKGKLEAEIMVLRNELLFEKFQRHLLLDTIRRLKKEQASFRVSEEETHLLYERTRRQQSELKNTTMLLNRHLSEMKDMGRIHARYENEIQGRIHNMDEERKNATESNAVLQGQIESVTANNERLQEKLAGYAHRLAIAEADADRYAPLAKENNDLRKELFSLSYKLKQFERAMQAFEEHKALSDVMKATIVQQKREIDEYRVKTERDRLIIRDIRTKMQFLNHQVAANEHARDEFNKTLEYHKQIQMQTERNAEAKLQALGEKYANIKEVTVSLEHYIMQLQHRIGKLKVVSEANASVGQSRASSNPQQRLDPTARLKRPAGTGLGGPTVTESDVGSPFRPMKGRLGTGGSGGDPEQPGASLTSTPIAASASSQSAATPGAAQLSSPRHEMSEPRSDPIHRRPSLDTPQIKPATGSGVSSPALVSGQTPVQTASGQSSADVFDPDVIRQVVATVVSGGRASPSTVLTASGGSGSGLDAGDDDAYRRQRSTSNYDQS